jgi:GTPase SAR1 family protein
MESFEALTSWHEQILKNTDTKVIIMLLGNKRDKRERQVPYNMAMKFAQQRNFGFAEVSAKSGLGVNQAFSRMV